MPTESEDCTIASKLARITSDASVEVAKVHAASAVEVARIANRTEELESAIAYAHGRLAQDKACPSKDQLAASLRQLADEWAG